MARPLRPEVPGGLYHITSRGNERRNIYRDDVDRRRFLAVLRSVTERLNILCHSYCLMPNHYHLLLETPDGNISLAIRHLNGCYAQAFNRRHTRVGHLFQGRFSSKLVQKDDYLLNVSRYVVLNPVRAGLVGRASEWEWSSYRALAGLTRRPAFLSVDWLLSCFDTSDRRRAHLAFKRFVQEGMSDTRSPLETGPILGSDPFVATFRRYLGGAAKVKQIPRLDRFAARPTLAQLFAACPDRKIRNEQITRAHIDHGYTMTAIARHLGLHLMTISRAINRKC